MNKQQYLEMCTALGTAPVTEELPVEYEDLHYECKQALETYQLLPSIWSGMGDYIGKDFTGVASIFDLLNIHQNRQELLQFISIVDLEVSEDIRRQQKVKSKAK